MRLRDLIYGLVACGAAAGLVRAAEPNETFGTSTEIPTGMLHLTETITPGQVTSPDTLLAVRNATGAIIQIDDNGSNRGNGFASGVRAAPTNNNTLSFTVSGVGDTGFTGNHTQSGTFNVLIDVFTAAGLSAGQFDETRVLEAGQVSNFVIPRPFEQPSWIGGTYQVSMENQLDEAMGGDIDFFTFTGLRPGAEFKAHSFDRTGGLNMFLYFYTPGGNVFRVQDNNGEGPFGGIDEIYSIVPPDGKIFLAVTGFGDIVSGMPMGAHTQSGNYELRLYYPQGLGADFNGSGTVDASDLAIWKSAFGVNTAGDADHDFDTDGRDFQIWQQQFGSSWSVPGPPLFAAVPEPTGGLLALIAAGFLVHRRVRRSNR